MISFFQFFLDNLLGFLNRRKGGCCRDELVRLFYDRLLALDFELHYDRNLGEAELFTRGRGDCEDRAPVLARYMVRQGCLGVELLYMWPVNPGQSGHVAVVQGDFVFDPTLGYYRFPYWQYVIHLASYKDFERRPVFW